MKGQSFRRFSIVYRFDKVLKSIVTTIALSLLLIILGRYIYIEASSPRTPGQKARILTPVYPATTGECIQFYYHMYGSGMGSLVLHTMSNGRITGDIFTKSGNQGNKWILGQATISSSTPYQVWIWISAEYILKFNRKSNLLQVLVITTPPQ